MKKISIVILCIFAVAAGIILRPAFYREKLEGQKELGPRHYSQQSKKEDFGGLKHFENTIAEKDKIFGAIVSHHLLAESEIAELFGKLKGQSPKVVVLVGPNHFNAGSAPILVSLASFETPFGDLSNNTALGSKMAKLGLAVNEEEPFNTEHSISALVGYVKLAFPESLITPLIIKRGSSLQQAEILGEWLAKNLPEDSLVIVSADFSHHFNLEKTLINDQKNLEILKSFDLTKIEDMEIDSKQSLALLFSYLEQKKAQQLNYFYTNASFLLNNKEYEDVTSYFFSYYLKGEKYFSEYKKSNIK